MFKLFRSQPARPPAPAPLDPRATQADILACYRLLLGRNPAPEEWPLHEGKIGGDLRALVESFTNSTEFTGRGMVSPLAGLPSEAQLEALAAEQPGHVPPRITTAADVYYCFRLLLGRLPEREEWIGHVSHVGSDLDRVVAGYTGSLEFARRRLAPAAQTGQVSLIRQDGFQLYVASDDAAVGLHVAGGAYEPDVSAVIRRTLRPGMSVIDIGANIGYFTMLAASVVGRAGRVLAVEPNPRNARLLEASRRANGFDHVTLCQAAAGREIGLLVLNTTYSNGTTTQVDGDLSLLLASETVASLPVDSLLDPSVAVDFIKIDVEGAEYTALLGCSRILRTHRPVIASEFSPSMISGISGVSGPDYLRFLIGCGYSIAVIAPDGSTGPATKEAEPIMQAHLTRGVDHIDILAVPDGAL
jgi:FkbM family methyltransferase